MNKSHKRTVGAIAILLMLGASSLTVTFAYADDDKKLSKSENTSKKERLLKAILTEKIVDGRLQVRHYAVPEDLSTSDMQRMLSSEGTTEWAFVNFKKFHSGIVLFDGKTVKMSEFSDISQKERENSAVLMASTIDSKSEVDMPLNLGYKVIFSGKMAESDIDNIFAISFSISGQKILENHYNYLPQNEQNTANSHSEIRSTI